MIGLLGGVGEIDGAPFNVEYPIGRSARYRGVNAAGATRISRATNPAQVVSSLVVPVRQDRIVVRGPRQTDVGKVGSRGRKLGIAVGRDIDAGERLVIQGVTEWYREAGYRIVPVIAAVGRAWHDTAAYLTYDVMVCRRTTLYHVIPCEGRIAIACESSDGPGANARCHAAAEIEMHRESHCHASVDQAVTGHTAPSIAGQGQVAVLD